MIFQHESVGVLPELEANTTENGRFYTTPEGNVYPSVTTVLSRVSDNTWLSKWKERVGEAEAAKILTQAGRRGTSVHELCEAYLKNDPTYKKGHMPANIASFNSIKPHLDANITSVGGLELPLYSDKLRVAGRVDCLAKWNGSWSIVDFKTSKREKTHDSIHNYFMQASCYAMMVYERLDILPRNIVIVMTVDGSEPQIFIESARTWLPKFIELRNGLDI
jgi:hypothetical protein